MALQYTEIVVSPKDTIQIFTLPDRRPTATSSEPIKWMYQIDLDSILYDDNYFGSRAKSTGAVYRLLKRTPGAQGRALTLRRSSVDGGLVTQAEFDLLLEPLSTGVRCFTLIPVEVAVKAVTVFGETKASAKLIECLGYDRPAEWDAEEESEGEHGKGKEEAEAEAEAEEDEEEGDGDEEDGAGGGSNSDHGEHSGDRSDGEASIAPTEQFEYQGSGDEGAGGEAGDEVDEVDEVDGGEADESGAQGRTKKAARVTYTLVDVPPELQRELNAFGEWRMKPINRDRDGVSVEMVTVAGNRADALRLLGWLKSQRNTKPSLCGVFGSDRLGAAVQQFVDHLRACGRTYTTIAGYLKSFISVARFVRAVRTSRASEGTVVSAKPVDDMRGLHAQAMQQARLEQKFHRKPTAWLNWDNVQTARARAVRLYEHGLKEGVDEQTLHKQLFDATLLTWLTSVPPDRVGVSRQLQLGVTLVRTAQGFDLDLSTPDAHKTAAAFGPTITEVPEPAAKLLEAWLQATGRTSTAVKPYVFAPPGRDGAQSLASPRWTDLVKAVFKRHAGVPLAPKELRASLVCWLRSEHNSDEVSKAAAFAMRHSTAQQAGPSYDRERATRLSAAAVRVVAEHAAQF